MTSEVKMKTLLVQGVMAEAWRDQEYLAPLFERDADWGPTPFRSRALTDFRWRHFLKPGENDTGLYPLGHAILIKPDLSEISGLIELADADRDKLLMNQTIGTIVEVGPSVWMDEPVPRAFPGETVIISKFSGSVVIGKDGLPYRMVNADDVYCRRDADWPKRQVLEAPTPARREKKEREDGK